MVRSEDFEKVIKLYFEKEYKPERIAIVLDIPLVKIEYWMKTEHFQLYKKQYAKLQDNFSMWVDNVFRKELQKKARQQKKKLIYKKAS